MERQGNWRAHTKILQFLTCTRTWFAFSQSSPEVFISREVEGHKHSWGHLVNLCPRAVRIYTEGKKKAPALEQLFGNGRWVPECLAVQYQGGLRALRKLKQHPGETFPWVWRLIPLQQLFGCNLGWKIKFSSGIVHGTTLFDFLFVKDASGLTAEVLLSFQIWGSSDNIPCQV